MLTPGAVQTNDNANVSFNGAGVYGNSVAMDGASATRGDLGGFISGFGQSITPQTSPDMIEEIKIDSAGLSAMSGRGSGNSVNVITKSGTNTFHGTLSYTFRNDKLDARNVFDTGKAPFRFNQGGATLGGPIVKGKTFFFVGTEMGRYRTGTSTVQTQIPNQALRNRLPQTFQSYVARTPLPTEPQYLSDGKVDPDFGLIRMNGVTKTRNDVGQFRVDHCVSDNDTVYFRDQIGDSNILGPVYHANNQGGYYPIRVQNAVISETHLFSPRLVNEFRLGFNYPLLNNYASGPTGPYIYVNGVNFFQSINWGIDSHAAIGTISENLSFSSGKHTLSVGFELTPVKGSRYGFPYDSYNFNTLDDLIANRPDSFSNAPSTGRDAVRYETYAPYFQDIIKLTKRLTLNLGLRYEYNSVQRSSRLRNYLYSITNLASSRLTNYGESWYKADRDVFDPRVGFTYRLTNDSKTVLKAAYGRYHFPMVLVGPNLIGNEPRYATANYLAADNSGLTYPIANSSTPIKTDIFDYNMVDPNIKNPYQQNYSLNIQTELPGNTMLQVGYLGTHYVHGYSDLGHLNLPDPKLGGRRPLPTIGQVSNIRSFLWQQYNGLQVTFRKRMSKGLVFEAFYAWSHTIDNGTQEAGAYPNNPLCTGGTCDRGNGAFDVRHNFTADFVYDLPVGKGTSMDLQNSVANAIIGGWQISGVMQMRTGLPFTVRTGFDTYGNTLGWVQRADAVASCNKTPPGGVHYPDRVVNLACFSIPKEGTFGNLGRNTERVPGAFNLDFSFAKRVQVTEKSTLQLRTDVFNFTNTPMFKNPWVYIAYGNQYAPLYSTYGGNGQFGGQRQIQFLLKFQF